MLLLLLLVAGQQHLANAMEACEVNLFRLPTRVQPSHYKLYLRLHPHLNIFKGMAEIDLKIQTMDLQDLSRTNEGQLPLSTR